MLICLGAIYLILIYLFFLHSYPVDYLTTSRIYPVTPLGVMTPTPGTSNIIAVKIMVICTLDALLNLILAQF